MEKHGKNFEVYLGGNREKKERAVEYNRNIPPGLFEKTGLDEVTIFRARRELAQHIGKMKHLELQSLPEMGIGARFGILDAIMRNILKEQNEKREGTFDETPKDAYAKWAQMYLEYETEIIDEMARSEYPIDPRTMHRYSALFGISTDFLLHGDKPEKPHTTATQIPDWLA